MPPTCSSTSSRRRGEREGPESSWGLLINYGVETMEEFPWLLIFPGIALSLTLFALNFLGDGLRDALDPRTSKD